MTVRVLSKVRASIGSSRGTNRVHGDRGPRRRARRTTCDGRLTAFDHSKRNIGVLSSLVQEQIITTGAAPALSSVAENTWGGTPDSLGFPMCVRLDRVGERPRRHASICGVSDPGGAISAQPNQGDDRSNSESGGKGSGNGSETVS